MQGAPAVGNGLGGLPRRSASTSVSASTEYSYNLVSSTTGGFESGVPYYGLCPIVFADGQMFLQSTSPTYANRLREFYVDKSAKTISFIQALTNATSHNISQSPPYYDIRIGNDIVISSSCGIKVTKSGSVLSYGHIVSASGTTTIGSAAYTNDFIKGHVVETVDGYLYAGVNSSQGTSVFLFKFDKSLNIVASLRIAATYRNPYIVMDRGGFAVVDMEQTTSTSIHAKVYTYTYSLSAVSGATTYTTNENAGSTSPRYGIYAAKVKPGMLCMVFTCNFAPYSSSYAWCKYDPDTMIIDSGAPITFTRESSLGEYTQPSSMLRIGCTPISSGTNGWTSTYGLPTNKDCRVVAHPWRSGSSSSNLCIPASSENDVYMPDIDLCATYKSSSTTWWYGGDAAVVQKFPSAAVPEGSTQFPYSIDVGNNLFVYTAQSSDTQNINAYLFEKVAI